MSQRTLCCTALAFSVHLSYPHVQIGYLIFSVLDYLPIQIRFSQTSIVLNNKFLFLKCSIKSFMVCQSWVAAL